MITYIGITNQIRKEILFVRRFAFYENACYNYKTRNVLRFSLFVDCLLLIDNPDFVGDVGVARTYKTTKEVVGE